MSAVVDDGVSATSSLTLAAVRAGGGSGVLRGIPPTKSIHRCPRVAAAGAGALCETGFVRSELKVHRPDMNVNIVL